MTISQRFSSTILALTIAMPAIAADTNGDGHETMLIPIAFSLSQVLEGAHGTQWTGEIWVHNASPNPVRSLQPAGTCAPPCAPELDPGDVKRVSGVHVDRHDGGALFNVLATDADQIFVQARLLELTRNSQPTGVELPVVREGDFFTGPVSLLAVPTGQGVRSTLRVYDPRLQPDSAVRVEFLSPDGAVLGTTELRPGDDPVFPPGGSLPVYPAAARILDITMEFPQLNAFDRYHVRLTPLTPGMEYWAMVSVTDNATQHVLLVTAQ